MPLESDTGSKGERGADSRNKEKSQDQKAADEGKASHSRKLYCFMHILTFSSIQLDGDGSLWHQIG